MRDQPILHVGTDAGSRQHMGEGPDLVPGPMSLRFDQCLRVGKIRLCAGVSTIMVPHAALNSAKLSVLGALDCNFGLPAPLQCRIRRW